MMLILLTLLSLNHAQAALYPVENEFNCQGILNNLEKKPVKFQLKSSLKTATIQMKNAINSVDCEIQELAGGPTLSCLNNDFSINLPLTTDMAQNGLFKSFQPARGIATLEVTEFLGVDNVKKALDITCRAKNLP
ncbi:MAG: hypothetical protein JNM93_05745 [Bacteriovoracaceae bacterium]|nr:hypothetical protein [Bacteriovoracaceae bacterium]